MNYVAGSNAVVCLNCGHDRLDERVWQGTGSGMVLAKRGGMFTKRNSKSVRFLVCARCGFVALFDPTAERPLADSE